MDNPDWLDAEADKLAPYVVAMHLEANRKTGKASQYILLASVIAAFLAKSIWPLVIGGALCVIVFVWLVQSCMRFVERETGMPKAVQALLSRQYKSDPGFAAMVNEVYRRGFLPSLAFHQTESKTPNDINYETWTEQLQPIIQSYGADNHDIQVRIYPGDIYDSKSTPLFATRPDELKQTLSRLHDEFGGGSFNVIVYVKGEIKRRFQLSVEN